MARILVVDDDPHMREVLELVLADGNRAVDSVGSGEAALERLARQAYDLVVCDLQLSDLDGVSVYDAIAEDNASAGGGQAARDQRRLLLCAPEGSSRPAFAGSTA